jgi:hypothetical protein
MPIVINSLSIAANMALVALAEAEQSASEFSARLQGCVEGATPRQLLELKGLHTDHCKVVQRARQALVDAIALS